MIFILRRYASKKGFKAKFLSICLNFIFFLEKILTVYIKLVFILD